MYIEKIWSQKGKFNYEIAKNDIFSDEKFKDNIKKYCSDNKKDFAKTNLECLEYFNEISCKYTYNKAFWSLMEYIVRTKIIGNLDNLKYNKESLKKLSKLAKENIIVILPNHKSVYDFMILPYILTVDSHIFPSVLAGDVFDIFPINYIFRGTGVYFVRRNEDNPLYFLVFKYYISLLLKYQISSLFFIEGGRNKSGDYSKPKGGVLKYILEGAKRHKINKDILFIPVSISYEFVPEQEVVVSEHHSKKRKHITKSLIKYISSRNKFGKCYLHFGDSISLSNISKICKDDKNLVSSIAEKVMDKIKESIIVTNTSLICYTISKLGKDEVHIDDLKKHLSSNYDLLKKKNKDISNIDLNNIENHLKSMESKNILKFEKNKILVSENSKTLVTYYRNNILHFFE